MLGTHHNVTILIFTQVEMYHSNTERIGFVSKNLSVLRDSISKLLQIMKLKLTQQSVLESRKSRQLKQESVTPEKISTSEPESKFPHDRIFVVVMDYDPQSLCITGQPELELPVRSGKIN